MLSLEFIPRLTRGHLSYLSFGKKKGVIENLYSSDCVQVWKVQLVRFSWGVRFRQIHEIRDTETSRCRAKVWWLRISIAFETAHEKKRPKST